jgi:hypothetical protein
MMGKTRNHQFSLQTIVFVTFLVLFLCALRFIFIKPQIYTDNSSVTVSTPPALTVIPGTTGEQVIDKSFSVKSDSGSPYLPFTINYPSDWTLTVTKTNPSVYTLSKSDAKLVIDRTIATKFYCIFPDTNTSKLLGSQQNLPLIIKYESISFYEGTFRRFHKSGYNDLDLIVCEKEPTGDYFQYPTRIGAILYRSSKLNLSLNREMDVLLSNIKFTDY